MKMSEALRLGSMLGPQIKHQRHNGFGGKCALGMIEAATGKGQFRLLGSEFKFLKTFVAHPISSIILDVELIIADLNNGGNYTESEFDAWTPDQIATWLEGVEAKFEEAQKQVE